MRMIYTPLAAVLALAIGISAAPIGREAEDKNYTRFPFTSKDLVGEWSTDCGLNSAGGFPGDGAFSRYYVNDRSGGLARYTFYSDQQCQQPVYSFLISYTIELGAVSRTQADTREALVVFDKVSVRPDSAAGLAVLRDCTATVIGQDYDLTLSGCAALGLTPTTECIGDYELLRVVPNKSYAPGFRTQNMCTPGGRAVKTQDDVPAVPVRSA